MLSNILTHRINGTQKMLISCGVPEMFVQFGNENLKLTSMCDTLLTKLISVQH